ncbi:MAG TPA: phosphomethylpyrimidine synthase, partial [Armatimonadota bacterium]|nr:phosphomethylpyrimidine synthase [Armatimonadota bacterium]
MAATNGSNGHGHKSSGANGHLSPEVSRPLPNSRKVYVEGRGGVRVPMREISLSGGEPPLRVYDTSGPQGVDVR